MTAAWALFESKFLGACGPLWKPNICIYVRFQCLAFGIWLKGVSKSWSIAFLRLPPSQGFEDPSNGRLDCGEPTPHGFAVTNLELSMTYMLRLSPAQSNSNMLSVTTKLKFKMATDAQRVRSGVERRRSRFYTHGCWNLPLAHSSFF